MGNCAYGSSRSDIRGVIAANVTSACWAIALASVVVDAEGAPDDYLPPRPVECISLAIFNSKNCCDLLRSSKGEL